MKYRIKYDQFFHWSSLVFLINVTLQASPCYVDCHAGLIVMKTAPSALLAIGSSLILARFNILNVVVSELMWQIQSSLLFNTDKIEFVLPYFRISRMAVHTYEKFFFNFSINFSNNKHLFSIICKQNFQKMRVGCEW